jgi:hypothetical protein
MRGQWESDSPSLIGFPWASADRIPPLLGVNEWRRAKERRYLIAHAHEGTMGEWFPTAHWLTMGLGGSESGAP